MDIDTFFSSPRWKILEILAKNPSSPIEIAQKLNTSVSYVSQQLKLLEAAGFIVKEKTGSAEKGKPRMIFSLANEILQFSALIKKSPAKKAIYMTDYHKLILRIWMLENSSLHYFIEKFYWKIEEELNSIEGIFIDISLTTPKIIVVSESKKLKQKIELLSRESGRKIDAILTSRHELKKLSLNKLHPIYDPNFIFFGEELKGGESGI